MTSATRTGRRWGSASARSLAVPRVFHGWYVVACAFLLATWGWGLAFYALGVYLVALQAAHGWSASAISSAITVFYLAGAGLIALLGRTIARFGAVGTVLTGIVAMAAGVTSLTVIATLWQLYLSFLLMAVGWSTMSGAVLNILVAPWFDRRQGLALSLAFTGASTGGVIVGPAVLWLVERAGVRRGRARRGAHDARGPRARRPPRARGPSPRHTPGHAASTAVESAHAKPLRSWAYWTISVSFAAGLIAQVGFITHQVPFLTPLLGTARTALCVSLMALTATVARLALGGIIDRVDARLAASGNFLVQGVGFALLWWRPHETALTVGSIVVGLAVGNMVSLPELLIGREFSPAQFAAVISIVTATNQVAFAFAPTLMGVLRDATGDYSVALALCLVLDLAAAVLIVAGRRRS